MTLTTSVTLLVVKFLNVNLVLPVAILNVNLNHVKLFIEFHVFIIVTVIIITVVVIVVVVAIVVVLFLVTVVALINVVYIFFN